MDRPIKEDYRDRKSNITPLNEGQMKSLFMDFFKDFREYLQEYMRDNVYELSVSEIPIRETIKLFDGHTPGKAKLKNQGNSTCFISTTGQGGYRLDPGETVEFFVNTQVMATTVSGSTILGFVKS